MNDDGDEYICSYTADCVMGSFFDDDVDVNDDRYKIGYYDKFLEEQNPKNEEEKKKKRKKKRSKKKKKKKKKPK